MINVLIATGNGHKFQEIKAILSDTGADWLRVSYLSGKKFTVKVEENGNTYYQNAKLKVDGYIKYLKENPALKRKPFPDYIIAEDSGLEVECLNNGPGLLTARYAGENASDAENIAKLLDEMQKNKTCGVKEGVKKENGGDLAKLDRGGGRRAKFVCYACLFDVKTGCYSYFDGELRGVIAEKVTGKGGFGYDPIFFVPGFYKTAAQLTPVEKNRVSHRGIAFRKAAEAMRNRNYACGQT